MIVQYIELPDSILLRMSVAIIVKVIGIEVENKHYDTNMDDSYLGFEKHVSKGAFLVLDISSGPAQRSDGAFFFRGSRFGQVG